MAAPSITAAYLSSAAGRSGDVFLAAADVDDGGEPTTLSYQWYLDGSPVGTDDRFFASPAGDLECEITPTNASGSGSPVTTATATVTPRFGIYKPALAADSIAHASPIVVASVGANVVWLAASSIQTGTGQSVINCNFQSGVGGVAIQVYNLTPDRNRCSFVRTSGANQTYDHAPGGTAADFRTTALPDGVLLRQGWENFGATGSVRNSVTWVNGTPTSSGVGTASIVPQPSGAGGAVFMAGSVIGSAAFVSLSELLSGTDLESCEFGPDGPYNFAIARGTLQAAIGFDQRSGPLTDATKVVGLGTAPATGWSLTAGTDRLMVLGATVVAVGQAMEASTAPAVLDGSLVPAALRGASTDDQLRTSTAHTAPPYTEWTWLGALRLTGSAAGIGGNIIEWGYYTYGPGGTQSGWQLRWSNFGTPDLLTLDWYDAANAFVSIHFGDAAEPDLADTENLILIAISKNAAGDVTLRALIGGTITSGEVTSAGMASTTPVVPLYEMYLSTGALSWALVDHVIESSVLADLPRTFDAPASYAAGEAAYKVGRRFVGVHNDPITDASYVEAEGDDAGDYTFSLNVGSARMSMVDYLATQTVVVGLATEADSAQPTVVGALTVPVLGASESNPAAPIDAVASGSAGVTAARTDTTDTAGPVGLVLGTLTAAVGQAAEVGDAGTATASAAGAASQAVGQADATEIALTIEYPLGVGVALGAETDTASAVTPVAGPATITLGAASEADTGLDTAAAAGLVTISLGLASEADTTAAVIGSQPLRVTAETDEAQPIVPAVSGAAVVFVRRAGQFNNALQIVALRTTVNSTLIVRRSGERVTVVRRG